MDNSDVDRVAAWLVKAGLAGMPEDDLMHGFCEKCRSIGMDLSTAVAIIDTLHPVYEGRAFLWRADGTQETPLSTWGYTSGTSSSATSVRRAARLHCRRSCGQ